MLVQNNEDYLSVGFPNFGLDSTRPLCLFDLWETLIVESCTGWKWNGDSVVNSLRGLSEKANIVVMSHVEDRTSPEQILDVLESVGRSVNVPLRFHIGLTGGYYKKPFTGVWDEALGDVWAAKTWFYCGTTKGQNADGQPINLMLANNIGVPYVQPYHVLGSGFEDGTCYWRHDMWRYIGLLEHVAIPAVEKQIILICGLPCSGKTHLAHLLNLDIYSSEKCGSISEYREAVSMAIANAESFVVDEPSFTKPERAVYAELAALHGYMFVILHIDNGLDFCYYCAQLKWQLNKVAEKCPSSGEFCKLCAEVEHPTEDESDVLIHITNMLPSLNYMFPVEFEM